MKKTLNKYIFGGIFFVLALVLCFTMGVVAGNAKNNIEFNISVQYQAEFDIEVQVQIKKANNELEYVTIFKSKSPATVNTTYIDSMTSDTINLKNTSLYITEEGKVNLNFINNETEKNINVYVNQVKQTTLAASTTENYLSYAVGVTETPTTQLGRVLVSLSFEETLPAYLTVRQYGLTSSNTIDYSQVPVWYSYGKTDSTTYATSIPATLTTNTEASCYPYYVTIGKSSGTTDNINWVVLGAVRNTSATTDAALSTVFGTGNLTSLTVNGTEYKGYRTATSDTDYTKPVLCTSDYDCLTQTTATKKLFQFNNGKIEVFTGSKYEPATQLLLMSESSLGSAYFDDETYGNNYFNTSSTIWQAMNGTSGLITYLSDYKDNIINTKIPRTTANASYVDEQSADLFILGGDNQYGTLREDSYGITTYFYGSVNLRCTYGFWDTYTGNNSAGIAFDWWLRSGVYGSSYNAMSVYSGGYVGFSDVGDDYYALRPAFVLNLAG